MGSWNGTCAVTGLPIFHGDNVEVIILKASALADNSSFCYPFSYNTPLPMTFSGEYNDYGAVEECHGAALETIVECIRASLTERETGDNKYHDLEVKRDGFDIEKLFRYDHEGLLAIDSEMQWEHDPRKSHHLTHITVLKEVYDRIVNTMSNDQWYEKDEADETGSKYGTLHCTLEYYRGEYDQFIKDIHSIVNSNLNIDNYEEDFERELALLKMKSQMHGQFGKTMVSKTVSNNAFESYSMRKPIHVSDILTEMVEAGDDIKPILENAVKFHLFDRFMVGARRSYHRPSGTGSQDSETDAQVLAANLTLEMAAKQQKYWDEM